MSDSSKYDLISIMQRLYASEINISITSFWDDGFEIKLGDEYNGFVAVSNFRPQDLMLAARWLVRETANHYPQSVFVKEWNENAGSSNS